MNWANVYQELCRMRGMYLHSISGRTDITVVNVGPDDVTVRGNSGILTRPLSELRHLVGMMRLDQPIHVDSAVFGSRTSRNHPETILANMPDVEWQRINRRKHIVWVGRDTHALGTLRERT